jgi:heptosyltransferase-2
MTRARRPLIVRLRNWVGDVILAVPMLQRLADAGFDLQPARQGLGCATCWRAMAGRCTSCPAPCTNAWQLLRRLKHETRG